MLYTLVGAADTLRLSIRPAAGIKSNNVGAIDITRCSPPLPLPRAASLSKLNGCRHPRWEHRCRHAVADLIACSARRGVAPPSAAYRLRRAQLSAVIERHKYCVIPTSHVVSPPPPPACVPYTRSVSAVKAVKLAERRSKITQQMTLAFLVARLLDHAGRTASSPAFYWIGVAKILRQSRSVHLRNKAKCPCRIFGRERVCSSPAPDIYVYIAFISGKRSYNSHKMQMY